MNHVGPRGELPVVAYENVGSDDDPDEDPDEVPDEDPDEEPDGDPEEEYEENSEKSEADPEADSEEENSNAELNEEKGAADNQTGDKERGCPKTVDETSASEALNIENASGKRKRSRWDIKMDQDGEMGGGDDGRKERKTRWETDEDGEMGGGDKGRKIRKTRWGSDVPQTVSDSELLSKLKVRLVEINREILSLEVHQAESIEEKSREKRKKKLVKKRQNILKELIDRTCEVHDKGPKQSIFSAKLFIPVKEYPSYNFVGLILGPRGNTQKKMETESGASIKLRGKGSFLDKEHKPDPSDNEELHVWIEAPTKKSLDTAVAMIEKILIPIDDENNEFKQAQLRELATLNGTLNTCNVCKDPGHTSYVCPKRESTFEKVAACSKCGSFSHGVSLCPVNYVKPSKEINAANLYVGYLPETVDDNFLKELFCPFGKITKVTVIKDLNTGLSKGYGFVNFESPTDAAMAVKHMHGYPMNGKMLAVRVAGLPPQPKIPIFNPLLPYPTLPAISTNMPRHISPWVSPPGFILAPIPPFQPGLPVLNPMLPYPRPAAISPNISSQIGSWAGPPGTFLSTKEPLGQCYTYSSSMAMDMPIHSDLLNMHAKTDIRPSSNSSMFPGDPDYRSSSSMFPGDPDYRSSSSMFPGDPDYHGSSSSSLFTGDFDFSK